MAEVIARAVAPPLDRHYVWPPNMDAVFHLHPSIMPGVQGDSHVITNSRGVRGDEFNDEQQYRILAVSGSTTECLYLNQDEAWPMLLQKNLSTWSKEKVWVGNVGKSGHNSRAHIVQVEYLLPELPKLDAVIFLLGLNELTLQTYRTMAFASEADHKKRRPR